MPSSKKINRKSGKTKKNRKSSSVSYVVAIPSYNRSDVLAKKTLKTLHDGGVTATKIHIFVANKEEYEKYHAAIPKNLYGKIVIGELGISNQRRFITRYFPEGQKLVSLDDDVEGLYRRISEKKLQQIRNVDSFFKEAFQKIIEEKLYIWGVYPVNNIFFLKPNVTTSLKFIIGGLYGYIVRHDKDLQMSGHADQKEDIEQSILYYIKDGGVLRYNNISFKTKFHAPGGLGQTKDRIEANKKAAEYLEKTYPQYATMWKRPNGMYEVRLKDKSDKKSKKDDLE